MLWKAPNLAELGRLNLRGIDKIEIAVAAVVRNEAKTYGERPNRFEETTAAAATADVI